MGWLDTLLNWLLALLEWVCWPCRLVEWLVSLEHGAAATVFVGALNAVAILGAAIFAVRAARSVIQEKSENRKFESAEEILRAAHQVKQSLHLLRAPPSGMQLASFEEEKLFAINFKSHLLKEEKPKIDKLGELFIDAQIHHNETVFKSMRILTAHYYDIHKSVYFLERQLELNESDKSKDENTAHEENQILLDTIRNVFSWEDETHKDIDNNFSIIEAELKPIIKNQRR